MSNRFVNVRIDKKNITTLLILALCSCIEDRTKLVGTVSHKVL